MTCESPDRASGSLHAPRRLAFAMSEGAGLRDLRPSLGGHLGVDQALDAVSRPSLAYVS